MRDRGDIRSGTSAVLVLEKAMDLLAAIAADAGGSSLTALAAKTGIAPATAHRIATTLQHRGFLTRIGRGRFLPGLALFSIADANALNKLLTAVGSPIMSRLARETRAAAHLGVFEGDMVTYLVKEGRAAKQIFTKEGQQLEAYCSGIGKALLAHLPRSARESYLAAGPFVKLTPNTITSPKLLRAELKQTRARGYALDNGEIDPEIHCIAVPIVTADGAAIAAASISSRDHQLDALMKFLPALQEAKQHLESQLSAGLK